MWRLAPQPSPGPLPKRVASPIAWAGADHCGTAFCAFFFLTNLTLLIDPSR